MRKHILPLFLAAVMAVSLVVVPSFAAFSDVEASKWYYDDVNDVQQYGIIEGTGNNQFSPDMTLSLAQALTMASRTYALNNPDLPIDTSNSSPWYQPYVDYAVANGIMTDGEFGSNYNAMCNRLTMATLFYRVFPKDTENALNNVQKLPDLSLSDETQGVFYLYNQGVLTGSDPYGSFRPSSDITRAEVAAILNRLQNPEKRKTFTLEEKPAKPYSPYTTVPTQKYANGTADQYYVQEGGNAAPAVADLNKDGKMEIIAASRSIFCLDAATGQRLWKIPSGHDISEPNAEEFARCTADVKVQDIDGDGYDEIITVHTKYDWSGGSSVVAVYDNNGHFEPGWPITTQYPVCALEIGNFEGDNWCEIALAFGVGADQSPSLYVYEPNGQLRSGWPVTSGYGFFSNTLGFSDLNNDGTKELVALFDAEHTRAWSANGTPVTIDSGVYAGLTWNGLPVCENYDWEMSLTDWARSHGGNAAANDTGRMDMGLSRYNCIVGTVGGVVPADVDSDGKEELVYTCMMVDAAKLMQNPGDNTYEGVAQYYTTFILNKDRTRYQNAAKGFDWTQMPTYPAGIVTLSSDQIATTDMKPVVEDLDGDGNMEILYTANDGQLHCWGLNGKQNANWPITLCTKDSPVKEFATRPVAADLNGDGYKEVIFGTYTQKGQTAVSGSLYIVGYDGTVLNKVAIPGYFAFNQYITNPNDIEASPVVADVDNDGKLEIVVHTSYAGVVVYDT